MQKIQLVRKDTVAEGTTMFSFTKPEGFTHVAGQTVDMTLVEPKETDAEGPMRTFSITSAPHEGVIAIATRMRDTAFKHTLRDMPVGGEVSIERPFGSFAPHENTARPAVFLSGGIGITPFHAIVKDAAHKQLAHTLVLFYSNRRPEDTAFLDELTALQQQNKNYKLVATMTDMEKSAKEWSGERGYIDASMIKKYVPEGTEPIYYLAGPQTMVTAMRGVLTGMGVSNDDIRFEEFAGY